LHALRETLTMLMALLLKLLKSRLDMEAAKATPVGGTVIVKGLAKGIRIGSGKWTLDAVLHRTE
jgi:hypothetical protein